MPDLMQVCGLWKNVSANGDSYLQGKLGPNVRILIFKNKFKTASNQPDFQIYFAPVERQAGAGQGNADKPGDGDPDFLAPPPPPGDAAAPPTKNTSYPRQTPEPPAEDFGDMEDPFAE